MTRIPTPMVHQSPPGHSTPKPSFMHCQTGLSTTLVSTLRSPTPTVHQSSPGRSTPEPSFMRCQTRPLTTLVSTPGSPTRTVHQPSPGHSTPEPRPSTTLVSTLGSPTPTVHQSPAFELSAVITNNTSASPTPSPSHSSIPHQEPHPMPSPSSQTIESMKSLETASECQGREESQRFDEEAWWDRRMSGASGTLPASVTISPPRVARICKPTPKKKESQPPKNKVTTNIEKSAAKNSRRGQTSHQPLEGVQDKNSDTNSGTNRVSQMGRVQQSSRLVREQEQQEEEAAKRKQAEADAKALRQKGASKVKSLQEKKSTVAARAKRGKAGSAKKKT